MKMGTSPKRQGTRFNGGRSTGSRRQRDQRLPRVGGRVRLAREGGLGPLLLSQGLCAISPSPSAPCQQTRPARHPPHQARVLPGHHCVAPGSSRHLILRLPLREMSCKNETKQCPHGARAERRPPASQRTASRLVTAGLTGRDRGSLVPCFVPE